MTDFTDEATPSPDIGENRKASQGRSDPDAVDGSEPGFEAAASPADPYVADDQSEGRDVPTGLIPERSEDYVIEIDQALGAVDSDLNRRLHQAGFSNAQAQLVYDLAGEILGPMMVDMDQAAQRATDRATLISEFGGAKSWTDLAPRIEKWGRANLPEAAFDVMCQTADGVRALHRLMSDATETRLADAKGADAHSDVRADIRRKMNDPRYWRDRNPDFIAEVQADFARLSR